MSIYSDIARCRGRFKQLANVNVTGAIRLVIIILCPNSLRRHVTKKLRLAMIILAGIVDSGT